MWQIRGGTVYVSVCLFPGDHHKAVWGFVCVCVRVCACVCGGSMSVFGGENIVVI